MKSTQNGFEKITVAELDIVKGMDTSKIVQECSGALARMGLRASSIFGREVQIRDTSASAETKQTAVVKALIDSYRNLAPIIDELESRISSETNVVQFPDAASA